MRCKFIYVENSDFDTISADEPPPEQSIIKNRHHQIKRLILSRFKNKEGIIKVVEIGTGFGGFAKLCKVENRIDYTGYIPSKVRTNYCLNEGLNVKNEFFTNDSITEKVNVILVDNVLEPKDLIEIGSDRLVQGGLLIVIVPNFREIRKYFKKWRERHFWQLKHNINYFTSSHLKMMFHESDLVYNNFRFEIISLIKYWKQIPKIVLDGIGITIFGLCTYGVKK